MWSTSMQAEHFQGSFRKVESNSYLHCKGQLFGVQGVQYMGVPAMYQSGHVSEKV